MLSLQIIIGVLLIVGLGFITRLTAIRFIEKAIFETPVDDEKKQERAYLLGIKRHVFYSGKYKLVGHWLEHSPDAPSVFILHGNNETITDWINVQMFLKNKGYNSFVYDYAGFGDSEGSPSVNILRLNNMSAWDEFNKLSSSTEKIFLAHSLGVAVILDSIKLLKNPAKKLIIHGGFTSAREVTVLFGHVSKSISWAIPNIWNNKEAIRRLNKYEITLVHSKADKKIPYSMGEAIAFNNTKVDFVTLEECAHNEVYENPKNVWKHLEM